MLLLQKNKASNVQYLKVLCLIS